MRKIIMNILNNGNKYRILNIRGLILSFNLFACFFIFLFLNTNLMQSQSLTLDDVLPPYKFTAGVLQNGHFYITTKYIGDSTKQLIYLGAKDPVLPPNFTSHLHFDIDNTIYQMVFEDDSILQMPPPPNQINVVNLFRDTLNGRPRINERIHIYPNGSNDTIVLVFSMTPIKKPSGGFIRLSASLENAGKGHKIGTLMEIDTRIGDNDRAPIVTSFGYFDKEKDFTNSSNPQIPEFWLALEGTPANPMLTARGNLKANDLITPDYFIFGNWKDYSKSNIKGLNQFKWQDRKAQDTLPYDDSAVLLIWNKKNYSGTQNLTIASTDIGIVDSLTVVDAASTSGSAGSFGLGDGIFYAKPSNCAEYEKVEQINCSDPLYNPYSPDSLQFMFLLTNTKPITYNNVRLSIGNVPKGLHSSNTTKFVIPSTLTKDVSSVGILSFSADPRLRDTTFYIPVYLLGNANDTLAYDNICITVPGLQARDSLVDVDFGKLCPLNFDTITTNVYLKGVRCRDIESIYLTGNVPDINYFKLVNPLPTQIPANGFVPVKIAFNPSAIGNFKVDLTARIIDFDGFIGGDTVRPEYTSKIIGEGKFQEFFLANQKDTLNLGVVCIGDTSRRQWPIINMGGCAVQIDTYNFLKNNANQFKLLNFTDFPISIPRNDNGVIGKADIAFVPIKGGWDTTIFVIEGAALPLKDTLVVIGFGDTPNYKVIDNIIDLDTICPNNLYPARARLRNLSSCIMDIDSIWIESTSNEFSVSPNKLSILGNSDVYLNLEANLSGLNLQTAKVFIKSLNGIDSSMTIKAVVANRIIVVDSIKYFGDVRIGKTNTMVVSAKSTGDAGVEISNITLSGIYPGDYQIVLPSGTNYPIYIKSGNQLDFQIIFKPTDIESRNARIVFDMTPGKSCNIPLSTILIGRGFRPIISIPNNSIYVGNVCVGKSIDTLATINNFGNGKLNITDLVTSGSSDFKLFQSFPIVIDSNKSLTFPIKYTPSKIGDFQTDIYFKNDGDWLFKDTLLHLFGTGIICATISIDSVYGNVGSFVDIPVRIRPDTGLSITSNDIANIMNSSGKSDMDLTISHNRKIMHFENSVSLGMIKGNVTINPYPDSVSVITKPNSLLSNNGLLGVLSAEVLLGDDYQSPIEIKVNSFAGKYSRIKVENGNLTASYCALDKRFVNSDNVGTILFAYNDKNSSLKLISNKQINSKLRISIYDILGNTVYRNNLISEIKSGENEFNLGEIQISTGVYFVVVSINSSIYTLKFIK